MAKAISILLLLTLVGMLSVLSVHGATPPTSEDKPPTTQASNVPDVPPLPYLEAKDEPGLILTTEPMGPGETAGFPDKRVSRMLAIYVPLGSAPSTLTHSAPYKVTFEGDINMRLRDFLIFSAEGSGKLTVTINDKPVLDLFGDFAKKVSEPVRLGKGKNRIVAVYAPMPKGDTEIRLFWATKTTPPEPVPPMVFSHSNADKALRESSRVREGRALIEEFRCARCHDLGYAATDVRPTPNVGADAPSLLDAGARLNADWMAAWIDNPKAMWEGAHMPRMFKPGAAGEIASEAKDIAAWLATRRVRDLGTPPDPAKAKAGGLSFANLSCVACHNSPLHPDAAATHDGRLSLAHVKAKYKPVALEQFLRNPSRLYAWNPMPDFHLGQFEAESLAAYLLSIDAKPLPVVTGGDPARGEKLFKSAGCVGCHEPDPQKGSAAFNVAKGEGFKGFYVLTKQDWNSGCLAADAKQQNTSPDFAFSAEQRSAIFAFFAARGSIGLYFPAEFAQRQIVSLRCTACHARDGRESLLATDLDAENQELHNKFPNPQQGNGEGIAPDQRAPMLTWAGEKLRPEWMRKFIAGEIPYKPRYYLRARMPGFGAAADLLAQGLAQEHGCAPTYPEYGPPDKKLTEIGQGLVGKTPNQSFGCVQCHAINQQAALAPFEAPAINFVYATSRLREDYYYRWIHNPLAVDPETKMPRFDDVDGKTGVPVFDNDARKQFEAIWNYLLMGKEIAPPLQ